MQDIEEICMTHDPNELDQADIRLLRALQVDASVSQSELAEQAGISSSQVSRRLARLKEMGVLRTVVALLDADRVGLSSTAILRVRLRDHSAENLRAFRDLITRLPEAVFCVALTGEADYLVKLVARDLPHFREIIQSRFLCCPAIAHLESGIVLEFLKNTTELPLEI